MNKLTTIYITTLILISVLPINGTNAALNNNYILSIRWDYILHALIYIPLLPLLMLKANNKQRTTNKESEIFKACLTSILIAISLEAIQYITPWRTFNVNDLMSNVLGVFIGLIVIVIFSKKLNKYVK